MHLRQLIAGPVAVIGLPHAVHARGGVHCRFMPSGDAAIVGKYGGVVLVHTGEAASMDHHHEMP